MLGRLMTPLRYWFVAAFLASSCSLQPFAKEGPECSADEDCAEDEVCQPPVGHDPIRCTTDRKLCSSTAECGPGQECRVRDEAFPSSKKTTCELIICTCNPDCPENFVCSQSANPDARRCQPHSAPDCVTDVDCGTDFSCAVRPVEGCSASETHATCGWKDCQCDSDCSAGRLCVGNGGTECRSGLGFGPGAAGALCSSGQDCASGICQVRPEATCTGPGQSRTTCAP